MDLSCCSILIRWMYSKIEKKKLWKSWLAWLRHAFNKTYFSFCKVYPRSSQEFLRTRLIMSVRSRSNWNLEVLVFEEYPERNLSQQGREPTTNSTPIWHTLGTRGFFSPASGSFVSSAAGRRHQRWSRIDPSQIGKRGKFSPLRKSCFPRSKR